MIISLVRMIFVGLHDLSWDHQATSSAHPGAPLIAPLGGGNDEVPKATDATSLKTPELWKFKDHVCEAELT